MKFVAPLVLLLQIVFSGGSQKNCHPPLVVFESKEPQLTVEACLDGSISRIFQNIRQKE
jgi:hypothetical protein